MAPAVGGGNPLYIIARKRLILNSLFATFTSLHPVFRIQLSTWVSVLLMAMIQVNTSAACEHE